MIWLRGPRFVRAAMVAMVALLSLFHLALLGEQVADGSLLDPAIAGEWVVGLLLLLGLVRLRRAGLSLMRGRAALVLWLLLAVLHAVTMVPGDEGAGELRIEQELLAVVPLGLAMRFVAEHLAALTLSDDSRLALPPGVARALAARIPILASATLLGPGVPRAPPA